MSTDLDRLLVAADPNAAQPPAFEGCSSELATRVARDVVSHSRRSHLRRLVRLRRRAVTIGLAIGLVAAPTAAWATVRFFAETGQYGSAGMTENDTHSSSACVRRTSRRTTRPCRRPRSRLPRD